MFDKWISSLNLKKKSIIITWLISYFCVFLVPVMGSVLVYFQMTDIVKEDINETNTMLLSNIQKDIDGFVINLETVSSQMLINKNIAALSELEGDVWSDNYTAVMDLVEQLRTYRLSVNDVSHFFVYFANNNTVVSSTGVSDADEYFGAYDLTKYFQESPLDVLATYNQGTYRKLQNPNGTGNHKIMYYRTLKNTNGSIKTNAAFVTIFEDTLFLNQTAQTTDFSPDNLSLIIANDKETLFSTSVFPEQSVLEVVNEFQHNDSVNKPINGVKTVFTYKKSQYINWYYICAIPESKYWYKTSLSRNVLLVVLFISLLVGIAVTAALIKRNYKPVKKVLELFGHQDETAAISNEFHFIENKLNHLLSEKSEALDRVNSQTALVRTMFLRKLLTGQYEDSITKIGSMEELGIEFISDEFAVIVFSLDCYFKLFEDSEEVTDAERYRICGFILENVFTELCNMENRGYVFENDNMMVCILNFSHADDEKNLQEIERLVSELNSFVNQNFSIFYSAAASQIQKTVIGINAAYLQAADVAEYKTVMEIDDYMNYNDISVGDSFSYSYNLVNEQQLVNRIRAGEFEGARELIEDLFVRIRQTKNMSEIKCLVLDIASSILKCLDNVTTIEEAEKVKKLIDLEMILKSNKISEMESEMIEALKILCFYFSGKNANDDTVSNVKHYIESNYLDSNLNVTRIAEEFELTSYYLSKMFKDKTGDTILNYINDLRMKHAEKLLMDTEDTVEKISEGCGYTNIYTFLRIFKKQFGITPGKYRELRKS